MKATRWLCAVLFLLPLAAVGCGNNQGPGKNAPPQVALDKVEEEIRANLGKLTPEDRTLAEAQKFCAVNTDSRLGGETMGKPYKVILEGEPVFLCCKGCEKEAKAHPQATVARAKELREKNHKGS
jgi:hypothetical protein